MLSLPSFWSFVALLALCFTLLYLYFTRDFQHWKNKNMPFLKPVPFFGNIFSGITMRLSIGEVFHEIYCKTAEPFVGFFVLDQPCLLLRDPSVIKRVLITDFQHFHDRNVVSNKRDDPIGAHILFVLKNPKWREIRTKITPVFTSSKIKSMSRLVEQSGKELVDYISEMIETNPIVEMKDVCSRFTVDVITSTSFGVHANSFKDDHSQFSVVAKKLLDWDDLLRSFQMRCHVMAPKLVKLFRMKFLTPSCTAFLKKKFLEIMAERRRSRVLRNDLIDILLEMSNLDEGFMEDDVLISQAVVFFGAGYETSSSAISFALYEIACHPHVQDKLRKEINEISEKHGSINYEAIKEMDYLDMCVKETLRKYPPLPFLDRKCNSSYNVPEFGLNIDEGTPVFVSLLGLHYDPKYFPEPEKFVPERFPKINRSKIDNFTHLAFGEGPRNCIGKRFGVLSTKVGIACIIKEFTLTTCEETPEKIKFKRNGFVLASVGGIMLRLKKI